jgi:hypothetical protein
MRSLPLCIGISLISGVLSAQTIKYDYDNAGNRIKKSSEGALPVELVGFSVRQLERSALLAWYTAAQTNFSHFEIEKSRDASEWLETGRVNGMSLDAAAYQFRDEELLFGLQYYRLKMVDLDGTFAYSKVVSLRFASEFLVYPNPVSNEFQLSGKEAVHRFSIKSLEGRTLLYGETFPPDGLDVRHFPAGVYFLVLDQKGGGTKVIKVIRK